MLSIFKRFYPRIWLLHMILIATTLLTSCTASPQQTQHIEPTTGASHIYYVSKHGNNSDALSWETAWNELDKINWSVIQPGDTILFDGGAQQMVYTTTLNIVKSGTQQAPITIKRATENDRNGKVVLFGGRSIPLPYCSQPTYTFQINGVTQDGIDFGSSSWIVIDGMSWDGISIYGHNGSGIRLTSTSSYDTLRNVESYDNGSAYQSGGLWYPATRGDGVSLYGGTNLTFEYLNTHDNSDDSFESDGAVNTITIRHTWTHETREDPKQSGLPWNQCVHQDGFQIYGGGTQSGVLIEESVFGPGLKEGTILGDFSTQYPQINAVVSNVTIRNTLFTNKVINILGFPGLKESNWTIDHVTVFGTVSSVAVWIEGSGHKITNSVFYGGHIALPDGLSYSSGNCQWKTDDNTSEIVGQTADPQFITDVSSYDISTPLARIANANFALQPNSPCAGKGSSMMSAAQLVAEDH